MSGKDDLDLLEESDATLQMDPSEVAKLHAVLAGSGKGVPKAAPQDDMASFRETTQGVSAAAAPAKAQVVPGYVAPPSPGAPAHAMPPAPAIAPVHTGPAGAAPGYAAPASAAVASGGAGLVMGGVGAILLALAAALAIMGVMNEFRGVRGVMVGGLAAGGLGLIFLGVGLIGAAKRTNATAIVAAVVAFIGATGLLGLSLLLVGEIRDRDLAELLGYVAVFGPPLALVLVGAWALSAGRTIGTGLSVSAGITAILGGATFGGAMAMLVLRIVRRGINDDGIAIAYFAGAGLIVIASVLLTIIFFGPLRKAPVKA